MSDPCAHLDLHTILDMAIECIANSRKEGLETKEIHEANQYLLERIMNYRVMLRTRPLTHTYEFMHTLDGKAGWYYKGNSSQNWVGPFASRKLAIQARTQHPREKRPIKKIHLLDQEIFGEI